MKIYSYSKVINNLNIFYRTCGDISKPVIIFLPGWGARLGPFGFLNGTDSLIKALSENYFVISIEMPGLIRSQTPLMPFGFENYANILNLLLLRLDLKEFSLLGNSFGGAIAIKFAELFPSNILNLILVEPLPNSEYKPTSYVVKRYNKIIKILNSNVSLLRKKIVIGCYLGTPYKFLSSNEISLKIKFIESALSTTLDTKYEDITVDTIMLWGKEDFKIHPIEYGRQIKDKFKNIRYLEYGGDNKFIYQRPVHFTYLLQLLCS